MGAWGEHGVFALDDRWLIVRVWWRGACVGRVSIPDPAWRAGGARRGEALAQGMEARWAGVRFDPKFFGTKCNGRYLLRLYPIESLTFPRDVSHEHYSNLYVPLLYANPN